MSGPRIDQAPLDKVLVTEELSRRAPRQPDYAAENEALSALAETMAQTPQTILQKLVEFALQLCHAGSAGVSILDRGGETFRWRAIAGQFAANVGLGMARNASPCGTVLDRNCMLLFAHPERHFSYSVSTDPPLAEALLAPFHDRGRPVGTVWVIAHSQDRHFDAEDGCVLQSLSRFAAAAYQMVEALRVAEEVREQVEQEVKERTQQLSDALTSLGQIAGGVAQELREPLNIVKTSLYFLNKGHHAGPEKRAEHRQRIERSLARTEDVISTLTNFSQFRACFGVVLGGVTNSTGDCR